MNDIEQAKMQCKYCESFFSKYRCNASIFDECDCPKCQGYCECPENELEDE